MRSFEPLARFNGYYVAENFKPGTEIAFSGIQRLKDGMKIKPVEADEGSGQENDTDAGTAGADTDTER